jgi:dipeptidyl aminopeptidase/acylaminoacyl peptidase
VLPLPTSSSLVSWDIALTMTPKALMSTGTASAIVSLSNQGLLFMRNSFTVPNDVFVLPTSGVSFSENNELRVTDFHGEALKGKTLDPGTEMWWTVKVKDGGEKDRIIHGWVLTPPEFKRGRAKKWPAILMIHGD